MKKLFTLILLMLIFQHSHGQVYTKPNEPGPAFGHNTTFGLGLPVSVNTFSGNLWIQRGDLNIPGQGLSTGTFFSYNSLLKEENHGFGNGWTASIFLLKSTVFEPPPVSLAPLIITEEDITVYRSDGQKNVFTWNGSTWDPPLGVYEQLKEYEAGKWKLTSKHGIITYFDDDSHHKVTGIVDRNGNTVTCEYSGGKLQQVTDPSGRQLQFTWTSDHLTQITDPNPETPRTFQYAYDDDGNMVQYTGPMGNITAYTYDESGSMTSITDPLENLLEITYDEEMAVAEIGCAEVGYSKTFTYNSEELSTTVTQFVSSGNRATTYFFDDLDRVDKILYPDENYVLFSWDVYNNMISYTNENGHTGTFTYDSTGNLLSSTDCSGNTESWEYESGFNQVISYTDQSGSLSTFTYDDNGNLLTETDCLEKTNTYTYDEFGNILTFTDKLGNTTSFAYDDNGNLATTTDALGNISGYGYDPVGNQIAETDRNDCTTDYEYDPLNRLIKKTDALGNEWDFEYDGNGNLVSETDKNDCVSSYEYDPLNRLIKITDALGGETTSAFNEASDLITETDPLGNTTSYTYDSRGRLISETDCDGHSFGYSFDPVGNLISETSKNGNTTNFEYDCLGRLISLTDPRGETEDYEYDESGNQVGLTDKNGNSVVYEYDCMGRLVQTTDPLGNIETHDYDAVGNRVATTNKNGKTTGYEYDALVRLVKTTDPAGFYESHTYDPEGNTTSTTDKNGNTTSYEYDCLGRLVLLTDPLSFTESHTYDPMDNETSYTDKNGNATSWEYDSLGRMVKETDPLGFTMLFSYDLIGNLVAETNKNGHTSTYDYDCLGRITLLTDALGNTESSVYDPDGHLTEFTDKNGFTTSYIYNCCFLTDVTDPLGETINYSYDPIGNRITATDKNGNTTNYSYDPLGRLTEVTDPLGYITAYSYDPLSNRISETDANGNVTGYSYDDLNRLVNITDALSFTINYSYDPVGNRIAETDANGNISSYSWDPLNRLISETDPLSYSTGYSYDPDGNRISKTDASGNIHLFQFDAMGRLVQSTTPLGYQTQHFYDPEGNEISRIDANGAQVDYSYDPLNRLISKDYPDGTGISRNYDAVGNLISTVNSGGLADVITYSYDPLNRLVSRETNYGSFIKSVSYTYDNQGKRTSLTSEAGTINYSYDASGRLTQITDQNMGITTFAYDPVGNQISGISANGVGTFSVFDQLNRVTEVITTAGTPKGASDYRNIDYKSSSPDGNRFMVDCGVIDIISPLSGPELSNNESVAIVVMNLGVEPAYEAMVSYSVDGGELVEEFISQPIFPGEFIEHTFEVSADLSNPGQTYELLACVEVFGDENPENNCITSMVTHEDGGGGIYQSFNYEYDPVGNKTSELHEDGKLITFNYDEKNQLTTETFSPSGEIVAYTYTPTGKRASKTENSNHYIYLYNADDVLTEAGNATYTVDNIGNRLSKSDPSGTTAFQYDFNNNLIEVLKPDMSTVHFDYSATGEELAKNENGVLSFVQADFGTPLEEFDYTGVLNTSFNPLISINKVGQPGYYHYNGYKSSTLLSGSAQEELASAEFDSYGVPSTDGMWINDQFMFKAIGYNDNIDVYDNGFGRIYDQSTGSFGNPPPALSCNSARGYAGDLDGYCGMTSNIPTGNPPSCPPPCSWVYVGYKQWECHFGIVAKGNSSPGVSSAVGVYNPGIASLLSLNMNAGAVTGASAISSFVQSRMLCPGACYSISSYFDCSDKCVKGKVRNCKSSKLVKTVVGKTPQQEAEDLLLIKYLSKAPKQFKGSRNVGYKIAKAYYKLFKRDKYNLWLKVKWEKCERKSCFVFWKQNVWVNKEKYFQCKHIRYGHGGYADLGGIFVGKPKKKTLKSIEKLCFKEAKKKLCK